MRSCKTEVENIGSSRKKGLCKLPVFDGLGEVAAKFKHHWVSRARCLPRSSSFEVSKTTEWSFEMLGAMFLRCGFEATFAQ